ncbi:hypothetical protein Q8A67_017974 [Cirrhinus molitorella]|uniref:Uncharacterized protein n=1 Tax=Cirrhinus molitorella TaxID=172907 RepID=A0AA88TE94_9TELE|nr:hypothetical protein Q8A67_017974 [Cirrhinus molitorella]
MESRVADSTQRWRETLRPMSWTQKSNLLSRPLPLNRLKQEPQHCASSDRAEESLTSPAKELELTSDPNSRQKVPWYPQGDILLNDSVTPKLKRLPCGSRK